MGNEPLTGAFVQLDVERTDGAGSGPFPGWLYKESPSLNVVEHPVYDVWPKSCAMTYPAGPAAPAAPSRRAIGRARGIPAGTTGAAADPARRRRRPGTPAPAPAAVSAAERRRQQRDIGPARHADRTQRGEVLGHELAIEQGEAADLEPGDQPG